MARAMWKASLQLGRYELPVKLYAAVEDRSVHFRLLHAKDKVPVAQRMVDPSTGKEVASEEVRRAVELDRGLFVVLRPEDLAREEPKPSRAIEVTRFVPRDEIDLAWYSRPYLLGPDGKPEEYFALARALEESRRCGVARWVMRGKRYFGALGPREGRLALLSLRSAEEVVAVEQLAVPAGPEVRKAERDLAEQLLAALDAPFDPAMLKDEHRERVLELIQAKAEGRHVRKVQAPAPKPTSDLAEALRASLRAAKERRVA
jgi:DNA end-binding protein Ku